MIRRKSKYGSKKVSYDGIAFDSKKEMYCYIRLKSMQDEGEISNLRLQVPFEIIPAVYETHELQMKTKVKTVKKLIQRAAFYVADFVYTDKDGNQVVIDAKGFRPYEYELKKKMMRAFLGITIKEL